MLILAAFLALLIGILLGLLGGGGAILTTPILVYVVGLDAKEAMTGSLLIVGFTSAVSMFFHARLGNVDFRTGAIFGGGGMVGAFLGGRIAGLLSGNALLIAFATLMLVTAIMMLRGRRDLTGDGDMHVVKAVVAGLAAGFVAGLLGAGGGFLIVPALVLFGNVPMRRAIGTSLFVVTLQSFAGFAGHIAHSSANVSVLAPVMLTAILGTLAGVRLAQRVSVNNLRRGFGWFVLAMGIFVLAKQLSPIVTAISALVALTIAALVSHASAVEVKPCPPIPATTRNHG